MRLSNRTAAELRTSVKALSGEADSLRLQVARMQEDINTAQRANEASKTIFWPQHTVPPAFIIQRERRALVAAASCHQGPLESDSQPATALMLTCARSASQFR